MSHVLQDGSQTPIAFHSKTLSAAERKYSHVEREAYAIIVTDYMPLLGILGEQKPILEITYSSSGKNISHADALSRLPAVQTPTEAIRFIVGKADKIGQLQLKTRRAKHQNRVANHEQIPASPPRAETLEPTSESGRRVHTLGRGFDSCPALGVVYVPRSPVIGPPACRGT
ncbi:uncharacterized protein LOC135135987 isoform X2 [Zophobas morio]|uniref:uncharacterized protein LOC135135987 isoform X2 n=1 Tax=Zophobas morio TaxID=2755281 RepID=UPI003082B332